MKSMSQLSGLPEVELFCHLPEVGFLTSLGYNVFLTIVCLVFGFKTRKLPENFNESRYIYICVCTTIFLWVAFMPTYFTTSTKIYKNVLLVVSLVMNALITLLTLFVPKIYALFYVDDDNLIFTATTTLNSVGTYSKE